MSKGKTAAQQSFSPDNILRSYWSKNEHFADLFNGLLFGGREVILPDELEEVDSDASVLTERGKYAEAIKLSRDNIKICKRSTAHGVELALLGMESQEHVHYAMPMRVMGYDYSAYKKQYDGNAQRYKESRGKGLTRDEFLSKMKKTDRFVPVITVVVYYGEMPWDGARSLHGMLDVSEEIKPFVSDYRMHLVEARNAGLRLSNADNVDLFQLLSIVLDSGKDKAQINKELIEYGDQNPIDREVAMTVARVTNTKIDYHEFEKGGNVMCTFVEEMKKEGREEGIRTGREEGIRTGREEGHVDAIVRMLNANYTKEQIMILGYTEKEFSKAARQV